MPDPRVSSFSIDDVLKYTDTTLMDLKQQSEDVRILRLPLAQDIDKTGVLVSYRINVQNKDGTNESKPRKQILFEEKKKSAIEMLRAMALNHELHKDKELITIVGELCANVNEDNFTLVKGLVLNAITKKMMLIEALRKENKNPFAPQSA